MGNLYVLNEIFTSGFFYYWLNIFSLFSLLCGISVIISKNPIVSVLFLIGLFFAVASYLMLLGLNFIGLSYLLVYVGAVSILFLFILMLINVRISELVTDNKNGIILSIIISILLFMPIHNKGNIAKENKNLEIAPNDFELTSDNFQLLIKKLTQSSSVEYSLLPNNLSDYIYNILNFSNLLGVREHLFFTTSKFWDSALAELSHIISIGNVLYTSSPLLLIITSIILLLAMVGAIVITLQESNPIPRFNSVNFNKTINNY